MPRKVIIMPHTRRAVLAGAAALSATTAAAAQEPEAALQPIEGNKGASVLGPRNLAREDEGPDTLRPPATDHGTLPNMRFSFADAHMEIKPGGWSREVTQRELPISTSMAGVNMRLTAGGVRELHWHKEAEWAFLIAGRARITAVDNEGRNFAADVGEGDLWYFPAGIPHSIQGLAPDGCEFLLAFPNGNFSEGSTFLLSELFFRTPKEALAKNFGVAESAFDRIPKEQLFIFQAPPPLPLDQDKVHDPRGGVPKDMVFHLLQMPRRTSPGGNVRIADATNFPISTEVAAALVEIEPGRMRELHWHPNADEWQFYLSGQGRMTVFAAEGKSRTFDFAAGDVGYVPLSNLHSIENTGSGPLRLFELFHADRFIDVSLNQWLALTPPALVQAHLNIDRAVIAALRQAKQPVV